MSPARCDLQKINPTPISNTNRQVVKGFFHIMPAGSRARFTKCRGAVANPDSRRQCSVQISGSTVGGASDIPRRASSPTCELGDAGGPSDTAPARIPRPLEGPGYSRLIHTCQRPTWRHPDPPPPDLRPLAVSACFPARRLLAPTGDLPRSPGPSKTLLTGPTTPSPAPAGPQLAAGEPPQLNPQHARGPETPKEPIRFLG